MIETPASPTFTAGPVADLFSSYVVAAAVSAAHELGLLEILKEQGSCPYDMGDGDPLDPTVVRRLLATLAWADIVDIADDKAAAGPLFDDVYAARGYFYWLVRGCGGLFSVAPEVAHVERRLGDFFTRDMRAVAIGSRLIGDGEVEPYFEKVLGELDCTAVADLGCGSAQRLIGLASRKPGIRAVGVDIAPAAVALSRSSIERAGLSGRVSVVCADVLTLAPDPSFADVDVVTCVFMGHDFWPFDRCVSALRNLRAAFPSVRKLLLCDVVRSEESPGPDTRIFTLGFELVHALMGVYLPSRAEWGQAFRAAGWTCTAQRDFAAPPGAILFELSPDTEEK
jgi:SAM-dependent methyltransferase